MARKIALAVLFCLAAGPGVARAQALRSLTGTVTDPSAAVPNANRSITTDATINVQLHLGPTTESAF